jgi:spore coat protein U-like protein
MWGVSPAMAQQCNVGSGGNVAFGEVSPDAPTDTVNNLVYTCQSNASTTYFRICMFIPEGSPLNGINPRRMTNYNGAEMKYNLYSDAARTQIIGAPPSGAGFPTYTFTAVVPGGYSQPQSVVPIYARVPAGQVLPAGNGFQAQVGGGVLQYSWSNSAYPANCMSGGSGTGQATFYQGVSASVSNACRITLATDLDFGNAGGLNTNRDQTSTITVRCPTGTNWRLGLSNGSHAIGTVRRMRSSAGNYITYDLYLNSARTQRWGNTLGTDTTNFAAGMGESTPVSQSVYGRVPAQASVPSGTYTDTVTVTLTY